MHNVDRASHRRMFLELTSEWQNAWLVASLSICMPTLPHDRLSFVGEVSLGRVVCVHRMLTLLVVLRCTTLLGGATICIFSASTTHTCAKLEHFRT